MAVTITITSNKRHPDITQTDLEICVMCGQISINGKEFAGVRSPGIVIALKRNGAYAGDIQVQQLGLGRVV